MQWSRRSSLKSGLIWPIWSWLSLFEPVWSCLKCYFKLSTLQNFWHFFALCFTSPVLCVLLAGETYWWPIWYVLVVGQIVYYLCICAGSRHVAKCAWIYDASKGGPSTQFFGQPLRPFGEKRLFGRTLPLWIMRLVKLRRFDYSYLISTGSLQHNGKPLFLSLLAWFHFYSILIGYALLWY